MRKTLLIAMLTAAGIWLMVGSSSCTDPDRDTKITSWKHFVPVSVARQMIKRLAAIDNSGTIRKSQLAQSHIYGEAKSMMRNMMLRDSCVGIRIYYGLTPDGKVVPIICGVTSKGGDIYWRKPASTNKTSAEKRTANAEAVEEGLCDMSQPEPPPPTSSDYLAPL